MFYFRINKVKLTDNKSHKGLFGIGKDQATVQLWSLVGTGNMDLPNLEELMATTDAERKKAIVADIVQRVAASRRMTPVTGVKDGATLTFGDAGYVLFQAKEIPDDFNWQFTAIKLNDKTRNIGNEITNVIHDEKFDGFAGDLPKILGMAANPAFTAAVEVGKFIFDIVGNNLAHKHDQQLGLLYMSLDRPEHYPHGIRNSQDVVDLTGNMFVDYSIFAFDNDKIHE